MLMLENLKKREKLIDSLERFLKSYARHCLIFNGEMQPDFILKHNLLLDVKSMVDVSDVALAGVSHGDVLGPVFLLQTLPNVSSATINFYLSGSKTINQEVIENELSMLAIGISIYYPLIKIILLPRCLSEFSNTECSLVNGENGCILRIKEK